MITVLLLIGSNVFMTLAWYGHLKYPQSALWKAVAVSWGIAFFEYCLQVPANRIGKETGFSAFQLKITQEVITLLIFVGFARIYLQEPPRWNHVVSFALILLACYFGFLPAKGAA